MGNIADATWDDINSLRDRLNARRADHVEQAAQAFAQDLAATFSSVVLARVFVVLPLSCLPSSDQNWASTFAGPGIQIPGRTSVLSLLGTAGRDPTWCDRQRSTGHLAIPLLSRSFVQGAPMIARLLADLEVDLSALDDGRTIATRRMLGGRNGRFFVPDAEASRDGAGRHVIPGRDFVLAHSVRTVFGMGGAYADGTLAVAIVFTDEHLEELTIDRFPSLISNFKMATAALQQSNRVFAETAGAG